MDVLQAKNDLFRLIINIDDLDRLVRYKQFVMNDILDEGKTDIYKKKLEDLTEAFNDVKLYEEGKIKLKTGKELLDEL